MRTVRCLILTLALAGCAVGQSTKIGESCDLAVLGAEDSKAFRQFDAEFRDALKSTDTGKIGLLVADELEINDPSTKYTIGDAISLQGIFRDVLTPDIRSAILKQPAEEMLCTAKEGIRYGHGEAWVKRTEHGYALKIIRLPKAIVFVGEENTLRFACRAVDYRAIVEKSSNGLVRVRLWAGNHSIVDRPDLLLTGTEEFPMDRDCARFVWSFTGPHELTLQTVDSDCLINGKSPPVSARGQITLSQQGSGEVTEWCF